MPSSPFSLTGLGRGVASNSPKVEEPQLDATDTATHLVVLIHGLWGNPNHLRFLSKSLREKYPEELHILVARSNSDSFTYDGIEVGGERVAHEIEETLEQLSKRGNTITKISMIGYSLGGLVARYAIGLLYSHGLFDKIQPINFTTFASPHLGVRTPKVGLSNQIWNVLGARTLSVSGQQLFTIDSFRDTGRPLLSLLADPSSIFLRGLARFKNRTLYANIVNDRSVPYYTSAISRTDPFATADPDTLSLNYVPGYTPVLLHPHHPISRKPQAPDASTALYYQSRALVRQLPFMAFVLLVLPLGSVLFLLNSGVQLVRSRQRIRLHEAGQGAMGAPAKYRIPLMVQGMERRVEGVYEHVEASTMQDTLDGMAEDVNDDEDEDDEEAESDKPLLERDNNSERRLKVRRKEKQANGDVNKGNTASADTDFPVLALTPDQFQMIDELDRVGFTKYRVWIQKARHSHAAIVVRMNRQSFEDGKVVVGHWVSTFEV
ncbi:DUF676-domain-containing protein [Viridothelium virens]|uniref:DUF676-domain-containing protein n=1 Tax=Viridothelium virens TaxID=1048519 RepID=A0A6A6HMP6_VIRVR|nr:DUF676-domain-containing protein [Viridothelium virens]